ncbi:UNVERIFIED_ORG: hypothetical protein ABIC48_006502 [Burkholderia territorii]
MTGKFSTLSLGAAVVFIVLTGCRGRRQTPSHL